MFERVSFLKLFKFAFQKNYINLFMPWIKSSHKIVSCHWTNTPHQVIHVYPLLLTWPSVTDQPIRTRDCYHWSLTKHSVHRIVTIGHWTTNQVKELLPLVRDQTIRSRNCYYCSPTNQSGPGIVTIGYWPTNHDQGLLPLVTDQPIRSEIVAIGHRPTNQDKGSLDCNNSLSWSHKGTFW